MARLKLAERLKQGVFVIDGAMGTQLIQAGAPVGSCYDYLNVETPEVVETVHRAYFDAGSDAVITNTFGGNKYILKRHGHDDKVGQICRAAASIARKVAGEDRYVLGDIGPCGDFLEPLGLVKEDQLKAAFAEQAAALVEGGVDGIIIETMTAVEEVLVAVEATKSVCDLPIFVSLAYDPAGGEFRTMMGIAPSDAVARVCDTGVTAIGFNCGTLSMDGYVQLTQAYAAAIGDKDVLLLAEPNAGKPELIDSKAVYTLSPEEYADAAEKIKAAGATILGGCCGTTPAHIAAMVKKVKA